MAHERASANGQPTTVTAKAGPPEDPATSKRLRAAAISAYLYTGPTQSALPLIPRSVRPLQLSDAIAELKKASGRRAERLQGQVASALVRARSDSPKQHSHFRAMCDDAFRQLVGDERHRDYEKRVGVEQDPKVHPLIARNLFAPAEKDCVVRNHRADINFDPHTFITTATVTAEVNREVSEFAKQSDPQGWKDVAPDSFLQSYRVAKIRGLPKHDTEGNYEADPVRLGSAWKGYLFEEVQFSWDEIALTTFRNVLNIDFEASDQAVEMNFSLYKSVSCTIGLRTLDGGLDVDSGFFKAESTGQGWTKIEGRKKVRFRDVTPDDSPYLEVDGSGQFLNYMAPALVGIFMDQFIYDGACFGK